MALLEPSCNGVELVLGTNQSKYHVSQNSNPITDMDFFYFFFSCLITRLKFPIFIFLVQGLPFAFPQKSPPLQISKHHNALASNMKIDGFPSMDAENIYIRRHNGLNRKEKGLQAARLCLGLSDFSSENSNASEQSSLSWIKSCREPVFVSIDTEANHPIREFGVSFLDTRKLDSATLSSDISTFIESHNFRFWKNEEAEEEKPFRFGRSVQIQSRWKGWLLKKIVETGSPDMSVTEPRNVILVGHSIIDEIHAFAVARKGKFRITEHPDIPIFDTQCFAHKVGDVRSLKDVLIELEIPFGYLHNAGNDAHFTLKLLFMQVVNSCQDMKLSTEQKERRMLLQAIAKMDMPLRKPGTRRRELALQTADSPFAYERQEENWYDDCDDGVSWVHCLDTDPKSVRVA